jgi:hypothetical protein
VSRQGIAALQPAHEHDLTQVKGQVQRDFLQDDALGPDLLCVFSRLPSPGLQLRRYLNERS